MARVFTLISLIVMLMSASVSILLSIGRGAILSFGFVVGEILRPFVVVCFVVLSVKIAYVTLWDFLSRDLGIIDQTPQISRATLTAEVLLSMMLMLLLLFWYQHGGFSVSLQTDTTR